MASQPKIDQAVLWKLYVLSESGSEGIAPDDLAYQFSIVISNRRLRIALEQLERDRLAQNQYHPFYHDSGGWWTISRDGLIRVERALRVPNSFIARLHANGDQWLESEEAKRAILRNLNRDQGDANISRRDRTLKAENETNPTIQVNVSPTIMNSLKSEPNDSATGSAAKAAWFSSWGTWVAAVAGLATLILYYVVKR